MTSRSLAVIIESGMRVVDASGVLSWLSHDQNCLRQYGRCTCDLSSQVTDLAIVIDNLLQRYERP